MQIVVLLMTVWVAVEFLGMGMQPLNQLDIMWRLVCVVHVCLLATNASAIQTDIAFLALVDTTSNINHQEEYI